MEIVASTLIGVGGLLLAAFSLWLSYRDRRASHRQFLYEQQAIAAKTVATMLIDIHYKAHDIFYADQQKYTFTPETYKTWMTEIRGPTLRNWMILIQQETLLLPSTVIDANIDYGEALTDLSQDAGKAEWLHIHKLFNDAYDELRSTLGVEPLSAESRRLFGTLR